MAVSKGPLVFISPGKWKANDFVEVIYEGALEPYYHSHDNLEMLILMEDGVPVHCTSRFPSPYDEIKSLK
jgi:hypothetical protein